MTPEFARNVWKAPFEREVRCGRWENTGQVLQVQPGFKLIGCFLQQDQFDQQGRREGSRKSACSWPAPIGFISPQQLNHVGILIDSIHVQDRWN